MTAFAGAIKPTDEIPMGALPALKEVVVQLGFNQICDDGVKAFSTALSSGSLASLEYLEMQIIGNEGMKAFSSALSSGSLKSLQALFVDDGPMGTDYPALRAVCEVRSHLIISSVFINY
tara:strand:+ start:1045 stop:1401 length:357 start_codon:yes stop_codon:yes gene_type:complete